MPPKHWFFLFLVCISLLFSGLSLVEESSHETTTSNIQVPTPQALKIDW